MQEMKSLDADFNTKVAEMNQAQGSAKVDAIAAAINDLAKEHQVLHQRMEEMTANNVAPAGKTGRSGRLAERAGRRQSGSGAGHEPKWTPGQ